MRERYEADIYRPGEDVSKLDLLSSEEKSTRRREIEAIFADPEKYQREQEERYAEAEPVVVRVEGE